MTLSDDTDYAFLGSKSLKVTQSNTDPGRCGWYQTVNIAGNKGYTFSAYVKTQNVTADAGNGATLYLLVRI